MTYDPQKLAYARSLNSDEKIATALSQKEGFDLNENLQRGYSYTDIVDHLALGKDLKAKVSLGDRVGRLIGSASDVGKGLLRVPADALEAVARTIDDPDTTTGYLDPAIQWNTKNREEYINAPGADENAGIPGTDYTRRDVREGMGSAGVSAGVMGAGAVGGLAAGLVTANPVAAVGGQMAASGAMGYKVDTSMLADQLRARLSKKYKHPVTDKEYADYKNAAVSSAINKHGLHEAGWEGVSNAIELKILEDIGKNGSLPVRLAAGLGKFVLTEWLSEAETQIGQGKAENDLGLRDDRPMYLSASDQAQAFKETALPTFMLGGAAVGAKGVAHGLNRLTSSNEEDNNQKTGELPDWQYKKKSQAEEMLARAVDQKIIKEGEYSVVKGDGTWDVVATGTKKAADTGAGAEDNAEAKIVPTHSEVTNALAKAAKGEGSFDDALVMALELNQEDPATKKIIEDIKKAEDQKLTDEIEQQSPGAVNDGGESASPASPEKVEHAEQSTIPQETQADNTQQKESSIIPEVGLLDQQYRSKKKAKNVLAMAIKRKVINDGEYEIVAGDGAWNIEKKGAKNEATKKADQEGEASRITSQEEGKGNGQTTEQIELQNSPEPAAVQAGEGDKTSDKTITKILNRAESNPDPSARIQEIFKARNRAQYKNDSRLSEIDTKFKDTLKEQGLEFVDLKGQDYNDGMTVHPDFVNDDTLPIGTEKITKVNRPQLNKDGKIVQVAHVEVSLGTRELTSEEKAVKAKKDAVQAEKRNALLEKMGKREQAGESNKTVTVNDQEITLTPEQQTKWDKAESEYNRDLELNKMNHGKNAVMLGKQNKASAMRWSAKKREITGALTPKEKQAKQEFDAKIRKGDSVKYTDDKGVEHSGVVDRNPTFGQVKIVEADGNELHVPHKKVVKVAGVEKPENTAKQPDRKDNSSDAPVKEETQLHEKEPVSAEKTTDADLLQDAAEAQARASDRGDDVAVRMFQKTIDSLRAKINGTRPEKKPSENTKDVAPPEKKEPSSDTPKQTEATKSPEQNKSTDSSWGSNNKIVTKERADELRAKLREKLNNLNSGIDPELLGFGIELGAYHIEAGARSFVAFSKKMANDLGAKAKPYLKAWYMGAKNWPGIDKTGMDTETTVDALNVDDILGVDEELDNRVEKSDNKVKETANGKETDIPGHTIQKDRPAVDGTHEASTAQDDNRGDSGEKPGTVQGTDGKRGAETVRGDEGKGDVRGVRPRKRADKRGDAKVRPAVHGKGADSQHENKPSVAKRNDKQPRVLDHRIKEGGLKREGSWRETASRNLDIIELVKKLDKEGRQATKKEKELLAKYTGFGASEIANKLFPGYAQHGKIYESWADTAWRPLVDRVKTLLTPEELRTAAQSTQYAHYTSEAVIRSIYKAVEQFGFKGGNILEPGAGPAAFWGLTPDKINKNSKYTGIEMDHLTASVAKYLYPNQNILQADFTKQLLPNDFFDIGIGNPPFSGTVIISDPAYKKNRFKLHDYFFAKTIDKVRPGGLLVFVTSRYTMDKIDSKARDYLSERADLLGAIRLPQTAFKENAGTDVVTDVLFLQKREEGTKPAGEQWRGLAEVKADNDTANINEYFKNHPEMILGQNSKQGSMYRKDDYTVLPMEGNIEDHFQTAVDKLPKNIYKSDKKTSNKRVQESVEVDFNPKNKKEGGVYLDDNGKLMRVKDGAGKDINRFVKKPLTIKERSWLKSYIGLRDAIKQAQYDQLNDLDWEKSLKALNKKYDAFVKKHGPIGNYTVSERVKIDEDGNEKTIVSKRVQNKKLLFLDVEHALVEAIEKDLGEGKIGKNAFLTQRTIMKPTRQTPTNLGDALALSLDETGGLDLQHISDSLGIPVTEVISGLGDQIYQNPTTKEWETADEYLSGNVLQKLEEARVAANVDEKFKRNLEPLIKAQPAPLSQRDITIKLGTPFIAPDVVSQFAKEVMGVDLKITYLQANNRWKVSVIGGRPKGLRNQTSDWGTSDRGPNEILEAILNPRTIKITRKGVDGKSYPDVDATTAITDITKKVKEKFSTWLWSDAKRAAEISSEYNRRYNNIAPRKFDGSHLTLPGVSLKFKLHPHQKTAIWRAVQDGNAYFAHAVGAGKTIEMIASGMEMRRLGLVQKPVYVVPKHMLQQFSNEFMELYPMANISIADEENFHTDRRRAFMSEVALNNPDAIIITHPSLGKISAKEESINSVKLSMIEDLRNSLAELKDDDENGNRFLIKKVEKRIDKLNQMFDAMTTASNADNVISFEDMGIDFMFVDEAHEFRKLDFVTSRQAKGIDSNGSKKTIDLFIKTKFLERQNPGRSHIFASGNPVTNTMGELYTLMRFFDEEGMDADGIRHFDAWANMFGDVVSGWERNASGNYEVIERFAKFVNVPELMKRVRSFMDVLGFNDLGAIVKRPKIVGGHPKMVLSQQSEKMEQYLSGELAERIATSKSWKPSPSEPGNPDPIINIITDGRLASIDMRFIDNTLPNDPGSKLNNMIDGIIQTWKETKSLTYKNPKTGRNEIIRGGTQIVFYNNGFGKGIIESRGFDSKAWLMKRLKQANIPAKQIAWIEDYPTAAKKETLFKDVRSGKVRILIGSAKKMGTGVNVQRRLHTLHYLDAPWYPSDVEQPMGRILRQGNLNKEVHVNWYATEGSYDSTMWQMVARKSKFIEQALTGDDSVRTLEDISEASSYDMATALSSGDERVIQLAGIQSDVDRLSGLKRAHFKEQTNLKIKKDRLLGDVKHYETRKRQLQEAEDKVGPYVRDVVGEVDGQRFDKRVKFGEAIQKKFIDIVDEKTEKKNYGFFEIGKINGFPIIANVRAVRQELNVVITKNFKPEIDEIIGGNPAGITTRMVNALNSPSGVKRNVERAIEDDQQELARIDNKLGAPFEYEGELHAKIAEAATLESELAETSNKTEESDNKEAGADKETDSEQDGSYSRTNKEPWPDGFPNATLHTQLNTMRGKLDKKTGEIISGTGHPDYKAAKSGDIEAAYRLVADLVKIPKVKELFKKFPDAMLAAPHAEEESGRNAIPRAMAKFMEGAGFKVDLEIVQTNKAARTKKGSALRLAVRPEFGGKVIKGQQYILVDDALGMGGTISELRHYIESNGGKVVHVSALTSGIFGNKLSIDDTTVSKLLKKFDGKELEDFLYEFNIAGSIKALTNKEGRYILKQPSLNALRDKILKEARKANISPTAWQVGSSFSRLADTQETDNLPGRGQAGKITVRSEILRRKLAKDFGVEIPKGQITEILVRDVLPSSGTAEGDSTSVSSNRNSRQVISAAEISNRVAKLFGKKIVFFKDDFGLKINGAHFSGDTIYINIDANNPYLAITGHELLHTLKKDNPELYIELRKILEHEMKASEFVEFRDWLSNKTISEGRNTASNELVLEEMAANFLGDQMMKPAFWAKVQGHNPTLFEKIVSFVRSFIDKIRKKQAMQDLRSSNYFRNIETVQDAMAKAVAEYGDFRNSDALTNTDQGVANYSRQEFMSDLVGLAKDITQKVKGDNGKTTYIDGKEDINYFDVVFSTIEHYARKVPVVQRYIDVILSRVDRKFKIETAMLNASGEDAIKVLEGLQKKDKKAYGKLKKYLLRADRNKKGFTMTRSDDETWSVFSPEQAEPIAKGLSEGEAISHMVKAEADYVAKKKGFSGDAVSALINFRSVMNKGFDQLVAQLRALEEDAKANQQEVPTVEVEAEEKRWAIYKDNPDLAVEIFRSKQEAQLAMALLKNSTEQRKKYHLNLFYKAGKSVKLIERTAKQMKADPKTETITLSEAIAKMGDLRGTYFPRQRESGELVMVATKDGANPIMKKFDMGSAAMKGDTDFAKSVKGIFNSVTPMGFEIRRLEKEGYKVEVRRDQSISEDLFDVTKLIMSVEGVLQDAAKKVQSDEGDITQHVNQILINSVADIFKGRGYLSARIMRNKQTGGDVYLGYEEDPLIAMTKYAKSMAGGMAKRDVARDATLVLIGKDISWKDYKAMHGDDVEYDDYLKMVEKRRLDPGKQKTAYYAVMTHYREQMRNEERIDRAIGTLKGLAVLKFLGFRVSSAAINLTNMAIAVPSVMAGIGKVPFRKTWGYIGRAGVSYTNFLRGKASADDQKVFDEISANGWDEAQFNMDSARVLQSRFGKSFDWFMAKAMVMFSATEKVNRATTIFAAYQALVKEKGLSHEEAMKGAKDISDKAHGVYGKATMPHLAMGKGPGQMALRLAYVFQKFSHNYLLTMKLLGWDEKEYVAMSHMLIAPAILAGAGASVLTPIIAAAAKALGAGDDDDPEEGLYNWADRTFGGGDWLRHGLVGLGGRGVNLKGSLQVNFGPPTSIAELLGAPMGVLTDLYRGSQELRKGNVVKGVEKILPTGIAAPFKALREYNEGITTRSNAPIFFGNDPVKGTAMDAAIRFIAFNPSRLSSIREKQWSDKKVASDYKDERDVISGKIKRYKLKDYAKRDPGDWAEILAEIYDYNQRVVASGRRYIPPITGKSIRRVWRNAGRPSRRERLRVANL